MGSVPERSSVRRPQPSTYPSPISEGDINGEVNRLLACSIATNTNQTYNVGLQAFSQFRNEHGLQQVWPPPNSHINKFIAHLSLRGYKHSTASAYIAGISFHCKLHCGIDPTKQFMVQKLLQGMKRTNKHHDTRLPITIEILNAIMHKLHLVCSNGFEEKLFKSAFSLAFYALLRVGEMAISKGNTIDKLIQIGDVKLQNKCIHLHIRHSKTDQLGLGTTLAIPACRSPSCPYSAMQDYLHVRPNTPGPLFCHFSGQPLTRYQFSAMLTKTLHTLGIYSTEYKSHSFRIGAATTLAHQGYNNDIIQAAGRWHSNVYASYIR